MITLFLVCPPRVRSRQFSIMSPWHLHDGCERQSELQLTQMRQHHSVPHEYSHENNHNIGLSHKGPQPIHIKKRSIAGPDRNRRTVDFTFCRFHRSEPNVSVFTSS